MMKLKKINCLKKRETEEYPPELLQTRYAIIRDEILWREYRRRISEKTEGSKKYALKVLQIIRNSPG
jgi:hypothetical protein